MSTPRPQSLTIIEAQTEWAIEEVQGEGWIGSCDGFQAFVSGDTLDDLMENIDDMTRAILADLEESGELLKVAKRNSWQVRQSTVPAPQVTPQQPTRPKPTAARAKKFSMSQPVSYQANYAAA